jgi:hypothetical protein
VIRRDLVKAGGLAKGTDEATAFPGGFAEESHFAENDHPGIEAGDEQQNEDADGDGPMLPNMSVSADEP